MDIQITGTNIKITDQVRKYVERKLGKLNKHCTTNAAATQKDLPADAAVGNEHKNNCKQKAEVIFVNSQALA